MADNTDSSVNPKWQVTIPPAVRRALKIDRRSKVRFVVADGSAVMQPVRDAMAFFGAGANDIPYDPEELQKARAEMGRKAANNK